MPKSVLDEPRFRNEEAAYAYVEALVWPDGRVCPHCGVIGKSGLLKGKSTRIGVYKCYACRKPFTVKVNTIFEKSHVPLHIWLQAMHIMCSSKKGFSAHQFCRVLGVDFKTGWFIGHRIREAMKPSGNDAGPLGGEGKTLEADETFWGQQGSVFVNEKGWQKKRGWGDKMKIVTLIERGGRARSVKVASVNAKSITRVLLENADTASALMTDEANHYRRIGRRFASHDAVNHGSEEWVRGAAHVNTAEGFFSVLKRGLVGVYQHVDERHLHRYLAEFDFRYNNRIALGIDDVTRTENAIRGIIGRRLTYRTTGSQA